MFNLNEGLLYYISQNNQLSTVEYGLLLIGFALLSILVGYLLGSVNSAIVVSRLLYRDDIRKYGSGNAGLTNMLRTYGKAAAGLTLLGDFLKTIISVFVGAVLGGFCYIGLISFGGLTSGGIPFAYIAGFFSIIGHVWPIYYNFKGGKGVLCTAVMALILNPIEFLILIALFALVVAITKYVSLGSVTVAVLYPVVVNGHIKVLMAMNPALPGQSGIMALVTILIPIFIVYCHRENLKRISQGTERKLSIGGKKKEADSTENSDEDKE